jgi:hypothetical protein
MRNKLQRLKSNLWVVFSEYIRRQNADEDGLTVCISCGKSDHWKNLDSGHYIPKTYGLSIYFEERNVHPQCTGCNRFRRGNLTAYALALRKRYGENILEELDALKHQPRKFSKSDYEEMIETYKRKLNELV